MKGRSAIGCISDSDPQPLLIRSKLGTYAICIIGIINNAKELIEEYMNVSGGHFDSMTGGEVNNTELVAALISQKQDFTEGIRYVQNSIKGTASILILTDKGSIIAARDRVGRIPVHIGKGELGHCVSFESFAYTKLDTYVKDWTGEIVELTADGVTQLAPPGEEMKICAFLYPITIPYVKLRGINVEAMRYRNGEIMAENDMKNGRPEELTTWRSSDSGTPHAIGYANKSNVRFARPFIKYTPTWPRSFMPANQKERDKVAKMKQIPVHELIQGKNLLFVDDSIVRGTQLRETVEFLYDNGAKAVHMRSACPPIMYGCKFLNFSRGRGDMELLARRVIQELEGDEGQKHIEEYSDSSTERGKALRKAICEKFNFASLEFQSIDGIIEAIGLEPCKLCTYCWNGKE
ncbi:MAG: amidophosphoribosyltransferase [Anaerovoracaceae bacterium]